MPRENGRSLEAGMTSTGRRVAYYRSNRCFFIPNDLAVDGFLAEIMPNEFIGPESRGFGFIFPELSRLGSAGTIPGDSGARKYVFSLFPMWAIPTAG